METILILIFEIIFVASIIIFLYHKRKIFGLVSLCILIGSHQYFQTLLSSTLYVQIFEDYYSSPGSAVLFSSGIFTILLIYIKEGVHSTRTLIYGIVLANISLLILSYIASYQLTSEGTVNILNIPKEIFTIDVMSFLGGTLTLLLDSFLIIIVYEFLLFKIKKIKIFWVILISILTVLYFDILVYSLLSFWGTENLGNILIGNALGKTLAGIMFSLILYLYIVRIDKRSYLKNIAIKREIQDVFSIITYRERYEFLKEEKEQVEEIKNRLIEINENKDRFFSIISHDLRSPFNAILGFLNLMQSNIDSMSKERIKIDLSLIQKSFTNAFELLNKLLDWSRIQMGRLEYNPTTFSLNRLIQECIENMRISAENKDIRIFFSPFKEFSAYADRDMIYSVVSNLLSNAIKFTNPGGMVIVNIKGDGNGTLVEIKDNGIGIYEKNLNKLFKLETIYSTPGTNNEYGTGLGLILSDEFLKKNGGEIFVESEIGKGSTFSFTLPRATNGLNG